jgi:hypothetical protein
MAAMPECTLSHTCGRKEAACACTMRASGSLRGAAGPGRGVQGERAAGVGVGWVYVGLGVVGCCRAGVGWPLNDGVRDDAPMGGGVQGVGERRLGHSAAERTPAARAKCAPQAQCAREKGARVQSLGSRRCATCATLAVRGAGMGWWRKDAGCVCTMRASGSLRAQGGRLSPPEKP